MKLKFDQGGALNRFGFDMLDPRDIEEMVFVIVSQEAFHLRRIHPSIRLRHINGRNPKGRKYIPWHLAHGEHRPKGHRDNNHQDRERPAQGWLDEIHLSAPVLSNSESVQEPVWNPDSYNSEVAL